MTDESMTESDIAAIARSDDRAWSKFYSIFAPIMRMYAAHKGSPEPDDVVQEVMVKFFKAVSDGRFHAKSSGDCAAYMKSLVRTRVIDEYRRVCARCGDKTIELDEFAVPVPSMTAYIIDEAESAAAREQTRRCMFDSWRGGDRTKAVYLACVVDGRSVSEVAQTFGIAPNTVSQIKRRGMRRFQKLARQMIARTFVGLSEDCDWTFVTTYG